MTIQLPSVLAEEVRVFMHFEGCERELDVIADALVALKRETDLRAIREGIADMEAGRYQPWKEVDAELRKEFGMEPRTARDDD